jgi:hypothetical protein
MTESEYKEKLLKKTCTIKELAVILGISYAKALRVSHIQGFPLWEIGQSRKVILSKLDEFLEEHIGKIF